MNYHILLVDDESVDLEWLKRRVMNSVAGRGTVTAVNSAFAALKRLQDSTIDILLSDIRMPVMSGLELAAKARELQPKLKIVFVSGHEDFGYAKQAMQVSATAYLLKPIEDHELSTTLHSLMAAIDTERQAAQSDQRWKEALPLIEKELVLSWLEGIASPQVRHVPENALRQLALQRDPAVALIEIDDWEWKRDQLSENERNRVPLDIFEAIEAYAKEYSYGYCIRDKQRRALIISTCGKEGFAELSERLVRFISERYPLTITIGIGNSVADAAELGSSYKQAAQAVKDKLFLGKNRVIPYSSGKERGGAAVIDMDAISEAIFQDMLQYQLVSLSERLESLFLQLEKLEEKATIIHIAVQFISRLHMHCQQLNEDLYVLLNWEYVHLNVMFHFETIYDLKSWLRRRLFELSELLYSKKQKQGRTIIEQINQYIGSQLDQKITLKQVAAKFEFSPNYLGQMFKDETGEHFSDHLIKLRINRACELLLQPQYKVYEIADQLSYKNILYFNRQFKQITGMTPGEYRKTNKV